MKIFKRNSLCFRIVIFICCVCILFLSPSAKYFDTYHIAKVHAVGGVAVVEGGAVAIEWLLGLLASIGLGSAAYENREVLASKYDEYLQAQIDTEMFVAHKAEDFCMQVYDKASDTIQNIPWQDYVDKLGEVHDVGVDNLTDIYVKLCPSLLGTFEDFITSIFAVETYVPGISDVIEEQYFTDLDIRKQIKETYNLHYSATDNNFQCSLHKDVTSCTFSGTVSVKGLSCIVVNGPNSYGRYSLSLHYASGASKNVLSDIYSFPCGYTLNRGNQSITCHSFSANIPIFTNNELMRNYFATGTGYSDALNYERSIYNIIDNDDLPTIGRWGRELWERVANAQDFGIGTYGDGTTVNDWATDLPFIGLTDLQDYVANVQDVFEKAIDDIIAGVYDPAIDIPDNPTYEDAWKDVIDGAWDDVIDNPVNNPAKDPTIPVDPSIPVDPDIPVNPDITIDDVIEIPADGFIPAISESIGDLNVDLKDKFPFCIPWDLYYLLTFLSDLSGNGVGVSVYSDHSGGSASRDPVEQKNGAPVFRLPIVIERYGIEEYIIVDMSPFEPLSRISRLLFTLMFVYTLINWTVKIVSVRKDD